MDATSVSILTRFDCTAHSPESERTRWSFWGGGRIRCEKSTKQAQTALINIITNKDII